MVMFCSPLPRLLGRARKPRSGGEGLLADVFTEHFRDVDVAFKTDVRGFPGSTNAVRKKKPPRRTAFARGSNSNQFDSGDGNDG